MKDLRTDQELNRIIAEWYRSDLPDSGVSVAEFGESPPFYPSYCTDLNAIHEAEKKLTEVWQIEMWFVELDGIVNSGLPKFKTSFAAQIAVTQATARQRAEALVAVIEQFPKQNTP